MDSASPAFPGLKLFYWFGFAHSGVRVPAAVWFGAVVPGVRPRFSTSARGVALTSVQAANVAGCRAGQENNIFEVLRSHAAWVGAGC